MGAVIRSCHFQVLCPGRFVFRWHLIPDAHLADRVKSSLLFGKLP